MAFFADANNEMKTIISNAKISCKQSANRPTAAFEITHGRPRMQHRRSDEVAVSCREGIGLIERAWKTWSQRGQCSFGRATCAMNALKCAASLKLRAKARELMGCRRTKASVSRRTSASCASFVFGFPLSRKAAFFHFSCTLLT